MDKVIHDMLTKYECVTSADYHNALKEILQELTLFALWRSKFFEHAAFYGGTALRILHGLNRFSEDLDFSLLKPNPEFQLQDYEEGVRKELEAFGFSLEVEVKEKNMETAIQSAFLKGNTVMHLLKVGMPSDNIKYFHPEEKVKIKFEIDTDPPPKFQDEAVPIFLPLPFSVRTYQLSDMFAGKLSAALFRQWKRRVKGRDWYDFLWFVGKKIPLNIEHFQARIAQTDATNKDRTLSLENVREMMHKKIDTLDIKLAKEDVIPFIRDPSHLDGWSRDLFHAATDKIQ